MKGHTPTAFYQHANYLDRVVRADRREDTVSKCIETLNDLIRNEGLKFNAIACSGVSGITIGAILAYHYKVNLIVIRKKKDDNHSEYVVEGAADDSYIIVDDLICSGKTIHYIIKTIYTRLCKYSKCAGILLYRATHNQNVEWQHKSVVNDFVAQALS